MWVLLRRQAFARSTGRMSSMAAPVVPTQLAKSVPMARSTTLFFVVPAMVPFTWMPPDTTEQPQQQHDEGNVVQDDHLGQLHAGLPPARRPARRAPGTRPTRTPRHAAGASPTIPASPEGTPRSKAASPANGTTLHQGNVSPTFHVLTPPWSHPAPLPPPYRLQENPASGSHVEMRFQRESLSAFRVRNRTHSPSSTPLTPPSCARAPEARFPPAPAP